MSPTERTEFAAAFADFFYRAVLAAGGSRRMPANVKKHEAVNHSAKEWVRGDVHTGTICNQSSIKCCLSLSLFSGVLFCYFSHHPECL